MAFENIFDASNAKSFKFETIGTVFEAYYMGSFDYTGDYGPTQKHVFKTAAAGEATIIFGQRNLMQQLPACKVGLMTRITYEKDLAPSAKGRSPMKLFQIAQDKKLTTDVTGYEVDGYANPSDDLLDAEGSEDVAATDEIQAPRALAPKAPAKAPDAAKQAHVQALLNRNKPAVKSA